MTSRIKRRIEAIKSENEELENKIYDRSSIYGHDNWCIWWDLEINANNHLLTYWENQLDQNWED